MFKNTFLHEKTLNFLERIMFKGSYLEKKKQLELSCPPIVNEYQNCCKELENIQNILVKLRKKHRGYTKVFKKSK